MHKLTGQEMNVKKLCRKENIIDHGENHSGFRLGSLWYLPLFFLSGSASGDVRCRPCLTLGSLFWDCQGSTVCGCLLPLLITRWGRVSVGVGAVVSPQAAATQTGAVCLSNDGRHCLGDDSALGSLRLLTLLSPLSILYFKYLNVGF